MDSFGRRIYYDKTTGEAFLSTNEMIGDGVIQSTPDHDKAVYIPLQQRDPSTYDFIELDFGEYAQDFRECNAMRVDVTAATPALVFSYPDPTDPSTPPEYIPPLSEKVTQLETENAQLRQQMAQQNADFTAFTDFYFEKNPEQA